MQSFQKLITTVCGGDPVRILIGNLFCCFMKNPMLTKICENRCEGKKPQHSYLKKRCFPCCQFEKYTMHSMSRGKSEFFVIVFRCVFFYPTKDNCMVYIIQMSTLSYL